MMAKMFHLMKEYQQQQQGAYLQTLSLQENGRVLVIDLDDVHWIESSGNYVTLHLDDRFHAYRMTMNAIEAELDPQIHLRIHRSFIVNIRYIDQVDYMNNNVYRFQLAAGLELTSGRSYKESIESNISRIHV